MNMDRKFDVVGIGNAILDVVATCDEQFLVDHNVAKGSMTLVGEGVATRLYDAMTPIVEMSGGSVANSVACIAALGGRPAFMGKVGADILGDRFAQDLRSSGVHYDVKALEDGPGTGRCLVNVTPDAQRSMATFLGASGALAKGDIDESLIKNAQCLFIESYLFDHPGLHDVLTSACLLAHKYQTKVAITLSDPACVERHYPELLSFIGEYVDIVFANFDEASTLCESQDINVITQRLRDLSDLSVVTNSGQPAIIVKRGEENISVDIVEADELIDTTGAGDSYAGGFLYGLCQNKSFEVSAQIGATIAACVVAKMGARPGDIPNVLKNVC